MNDVNVTSFIYITLKNVVGLHTISDFVKTDKYLQGVCTDDHRYKTFRLDRIIKELDSGDNALVVLESYKEHFSKVAPQIVSKPRNIQGKLQVCFTGFKAVLKKELSDRAEAAGMHVAKSVVMDLDFLCVFGDLSPANTLKNKKLTKARQQGSILLNETEFIKLLETGEIPEI